MAFALKLAKTPQGDHRPEGRRGRRVLDLTQHLDRKPANLSGGQRQRVAMGRAIVRDPQAFLMDEPLSNLDAKLRVQMRTEVSRLQQRLGTTTVYVTHDQTEAMTLGDRVAVHARRRPPAGRPAAGALQRNPINLFVAGLHRLARDELHAGDASRRACCAPSSATCRSATSCGGPSRQRERRSRGDPRHAAGELRGRRARAADGPAGYGVTFTAPIDVRRVDGVRRVRLLRARRAARRERRSSRSWRATRAGRHRRRQRPGRRPPRRRDPDQGRRERRRCGSTPGRSTSSTPASRRANLDGAPGRHGFRRRPELSLLSQPLDDVVVPVVGEDQPVALGGDPQVRLGVAAVAQEVGLAQHPDDRRVLLGEPAAGDLGPVAEALLVLHAPEAPCLDAPRRARRTTTGRVTVILARVCAGQRDARRGTSARSS